MFDVGTIFNIEGSDTGRACFRHLVFQELQNPESWKALSDELDSQGVLKADNAGLLKDMLEKFKQTGAPTHHGGMIERETGKVFAKGYPGKPSNLTLIRKFKVLKPELKRLLGWYFYDYEVFSGQDGYVVPLEYIVRFGLTSGSSILRKYTAMNASGKSAYLAELGVDTPLRSWMQFTPPVMDLTTKFEPEDRNISRQEASLTSSLGGAGFAKSMVMVQLGAYMLRRIFSRMGLFLWDLKWELARDGEDLVFVDTIDTDSVRATVNVEDGGKSYFVHFNKQTMRDYYRIMHPEWLTAINEAKSAAAKTGQPFTQVLAEGQQSGKYAGTPELDETFHDIQKAKFSMIQHFIQIQDSGEDVRAAAERIAKMEIEYYLKSNKKESYEALNVAVKERAG
ncbi:hypothetical protein H8E50_13580 [bacterium]|nr:hypothetical protein [bacterium]